MNYKKYFKRDIKLRAWDELNKKIINNIGITPKNVVYTQDMENNVFDVFPGCILIQYTGLKDINENEIFEGDIIQCTDNKNIYICLYSKGCFWLRNINEENSIRGLIFEFQGTLKIIGNVFENEELLND